MSRFQAASGADLEASLLSFEKLDRASPDLWPEQLPGVAEFAASFKSVHPAILRLSSIPDPNRWMFQPPATCQSLDLLDSFFFFGTIGKGQYALMLYQRFGAT
ncbi:protein lin-52 homolog isoform X2 [Ambystoma mexicanum]|uniref:protein lin-52 homolog isoform X2 n=1 Tax=Ambystoma mexicanum TaxID=8296 RepID=UPI0037E79846